MSLPPVVSREQWSKTRKDLLADEKDLTRRRDALNVKRRELPMVAVEKEYVFAGPAGEASLLDLFEGRRQLIVVHFMYDPEWDVGCSSCTASADELSVGLLEHLATRDTTLAHVSRAPIEKLEAWKDDHGWTFPWYSSGGSDFNYDFHATLDASVAPMVFNFAPIELSADEQPYELPGRSVFLRVNDRVFHTYSDWARSAEWTGGAYAWLDLTALGRQEDWEKPEDRSEDVRVAHPDFAS